MPASRPRPPLDGDRATRAAPAALTSSSGAADAAPDPAAQVAAPAVTRVGFAPIVRVDSPQREIELCATSEAVDSYGTIFDYAASKDAFQRWIGNVREMHESRVVGSRVAVRFDDPARRIYVTARISRGAQDTWDKILDGTLRGASIGASNANWERQVRRVGLRDRLLDRIARLRANAISEFITTKRSCPAAALAQQPGVRRRGGAVRPHCSEYDEQSYEEWKAQVAATCGPTNRGGKPQVTALGREYPRDRIRQLGESSTSVPLTVTTERERARECRRSLPKVLPPDRFPPSRPNTVTCYPCLQVESFGRILS